MLSTFNIQHSAYFTEMKRFIHAFKKLRSSRTPPPGEEEAEDLRIEFKERYHHFKLLLNANQQALEIMADIEHALRIRPFGMTFVRSSCTGAAVNVMRMIRSIERLAPGKYPKLRLRFDILNQAVQKEIAPAYAVKQESLVISLEELDRSGTELAGEKMATLGEIRNRLSISVPEGFVITTRAYERFLSGAKLQEEIDRLFQASDTSDSNSLHDLSARIQQLIVKTPVPDNLANAIYQAWKKLADSRGSKKTAVAVRSSSLFEDTAGASFAGQFRTELNVSRDSLLTAYREVVASKYGVHAITYRVNKGFRDEDIAVAVGCVVMVDAESGGVAYSTAPIDPDDDSVHISSAWGLPKAVVDGSTACDQFVVARSGDPFPIRSTIDRKTSCFVCYPEEGVQRIQLSEDKAAAPSLEQAQIRDLAAIVLKLEKYYGKPVDVEWAVTPHRDIVILQCRPLKRPDSKTQKPGLETPSNKVILKDGITAAQGAGAGPVFKASKSMDLLKFPDGGVLVIRQASPQWAALIGRAAAIVAEQGGAAGHLANVAREFGVPALFGCKNAFEKLTQSEIVTVDADSQKIYQDRIESLLVPKDTSVNPIDGSPVYRILESAGRHITPLTLLDPASPEFRPSNCKTFHDITRFIHERSVHDMFSFGHEHGFAERSGKQLHYKVPMQWWVLNLDDGFKEEISGKYVRLEQIASIPMLAFWEGFTAIPWDGPPALDRRGFTSVLFQSTVNPALASGGKSKFAEKNYFMISRHFCNLNSRLGYHFSIMEALVSERSLENYVSFQFKGGAADYARRLKRVRFIGDILETYDFRVEIREDNLISRIENFDMNVMKQRIKILGHLSLHTRQLDMIMENAAQVNYFRSKLLTDIERLNAF